MDKDMPWILQMLGLGLDMFRDQTQEIRIPIQELRTDSTPRVQQATSDRHGFS